MNNIRNLDWFSIDKTDFTGIGRGMLKCTNQINYKTSPSRQTDGSMINVNTYDSFVIPQVEIGFKLISIEDFYKLRQILLAKRVFEVIYFDIDFKSFVAHEMYCHPDELKDFLNRGEDVIGISNYTITFVASLNGKDKVFTENEYKSGYTAGMTPEEQRESIRSYFRSFDFSTISEKYSVSGLGATSKQVKWGRSTAVPSTAFALYPSGYYTINGDTEKWRKFKKGDRINVFNDITLTFNSGV